MTQKWLENDTKMDTIFQKIEILKKHYVLLSVTAAATTTTCHCHRHFAKYT